MSWSATSAALLRCLSTVFIIISACCESISIVASDLAYNEFQVEHINFEEAYIFLS